LFSEEFIALAILRLVEMEKAVVEGAGAIGLAAVLGNYVPELKGKKYVSFYLLMGVFRAALAPPPLEVKNALIFNEIKIKLNFDHF